MTNIEDCTITINENIYYKTKLNVQYIKKLNQYNKVIFIGPHVNPGIKLNRIIALKILNNRNILDKIYIADCNIKLIDNYLFNFFKENEILYISKVSALSFDIKKDYIIGNEFTFRDQDHWSKQGELYFGNKLINNSILSKILFK
jgi:hypothetical protein